MSYVRGQSRDQCALFPLALDELVGADHVCRVIEAFVRSLDLRALGFAHAQSKATGRPPYDPADLLALYLYGYLHRVRSSRRLERECQRNVEVMWLLSHLRPDHKTIAEFRRVNGPALKQAGARFVRLCAQAGLVRGEWIAVDGSKFQAVASGKAVVNAEELDEQQQRLEQRMAQYLNEMDQADVQAPPPEPDAQAVRQALAKLAQQREQLAQAQAGGAKRVVSTEPEAVVLKGKGPGYNVQTAVDAEHALIVAHEVNAQAGDNGCLQTMGEAARQALGAGFNLVADAGYANGEQAQALEDLGIAVHVPVKRAINNQGAGVLFDQARFSYDPQRDAYTCPADKLLQRKQLHRAHKVVVYAAQASDCADCALKAQCTRAARRLIERHLHEQAIVRMQQRATPQAMRLRRCTVEHPFAALKYQILEKPRLLLRGLKGAATEMALATLAYNLKRALAVLGAQAMIGAIAQA